MVMNDCLVSVNHHAATSKISMAQHFKVANRFHLSIDDLKVFRGNIAR